MDNFKLLTNSEKIYEHMLKDINKAKKSIFLETYIYDNDFVGDIFKEALIDKAKKGIEIKLLIDAWGSSAKRDFFSELIEAGAQVKFFREFKYVFRIFSKNHERNHRKLLIIDNNIAYIGSCNITASCLEWRELVLRLRGNISEHFKESFLNSWQNYKRISKEIRSIIHKGFEIIQDTPSKKERKTEKKYVELIRKAKKEILIETPYFVPSFKIRRALCKAAKEGIKIQVILPYISDVRIVDILRDIYLGALHKSGVKLYYYKKRVLHSKLMLVDNLFILGSSNLDYRSLIHQYEINLLGKDKNIIIALKRYFNHDLISCIKFNYQEWKDRSSFRKLLELFLIKVRHYF